MNSAAIREQQATACLAAAERYQPQLLALGVALSGSKEAGMELFQQATLNCHDAIQTGGFEGEHYQFYLRKAIKNLHYRTVAEQQRTQSLDVQPLPNFIDADEAFLVPSVNQKVILTLEALHAASPPPECDAQAQLAEQVMTEVREQFSGPDRLALRLHVDGFSCQQIVELTGSSLDRRRIWERLTHMKDHLRATFWQAWQALAE